MKKTSKFLGILAAAALALSATGIAPAYAGGRGALPPGPGIGYQLTPYVCLQEDTDENETFSFFVSVIAGHVVALEMGTTDVDLTGAEYAGGVFSGVNGTEYRNFTFAGSGQCDDFAGPFLVIQGTLPTGANFLFGETCEDAQVIRGPLIPGFTNVAFTAADFGVPPGTNINNMWWQIFSNEDGSLSESFVTPGYLNQHAVLANLVPALEYCPLNVFEFDE